MWLYGPASCVIWCCLTDRWVRALLFQHNLVRVPQRVVHSSHSQPLGQMGLSYFFLENTTLTPRPVFYALIKLNTHQNAEVVVVKSRGTKEAVSCGRFSIMPPNSRLVLLLPVLECQQHNICLLFMPYIYTGFSLCVGSRTK